MLVQVLYELNRFFNMAAFNPKGREGLPASCKTKAGCSGGDAATAAKRDEGYLFWVGWVTHLTDSLFNTSDANGPFRRSIFGVNCNTILAQLNTGLGQVGPLGPGLKGAATSVENTLFGLNTVATTGVCKP